MRAYINHIIFLFFALIVFNNAVGQILPEYDMSDTTLTDCQGILYDNGGQNGLYGNNLNLTTVIQTGGPITITFQGLFNIEPGLDFLMVYDGALPGGTLLATLSGTNLPGVYVASSGILTLVFTSDNSAVYGGFTLQWETEVPPPIPPNIAIAPFLTCGQSSMTVELSYPLQCDWIAAATFEVNSELGEELIVSGINVDCIDNTASSIELELQEGPNKNCIYTVVMNVQIPDICGAFHPFVLTNSMQMEACPILGQIVSDVASVCPGACAELVLSLSGCSDYTYTWSNGLPSTPGPHQVCPLSTTTYTVEVTELNTAITQTFTFTLEVESAQIMDEDMEICQSIDAFTLQAGVSGVWSGPGIIDETIGLFEPDSANAGANLIFFETLTCRDSIVITILPISTDNIVAACPGSDPFQLNAEPIGGVWSGPNTTTSGVFDPNTLGIYVVYYQTAQCTDSVVVNVDDISGSFVIDTICQSAWSDTIMFSPLGGYWLGPAIIDSLLGVYSPEYAPAGETMFTYFINGCQQDFTGFIKEVYAGDRFHTACPLEEPQVFYTTPPVPANGLWSGDGIVDTSTGLFDPGLIADGTYVELLYDALNGCSDTVYVYVRQTVIGVAALDFCYSDDPLVLNEDNVQNDPSWGGVWNGPGVAYSNDEWLFQPSSGGEGAYYIYYTRNTCTDSLRIRVFPDGVSPSTDVFCSTDDPVSFGAGVTFGGTWSGSGIIDNTNGVFDPGAADAGTYPIYWTSPAGCNDSIIVTVENIELIAIQNVNETYCFLDSNYVISIVPDGGVLTGSLSGDTLNPSVLGEGSYEIIYTYSGIACEGADTASFIIYPPIMGELVAADSTLCEGDATILTANGEGGLPGVSLSYTWSNGAFPVNTQVYSSSNTSTVEVIISDGCSEPSVHSVTIEIFPPIAYEVLTGDTLCFGEQSSAEVIYLEAGNYSTMWDDLSGESIIVDAGSVVNLLMENLDTGCEEETIVSIPAYPPVVANFSINPNLDCIPFSQRENIQFIDFSQNASSGTWFLGEETVDYVPGVTPTFSAVGAGQTLITLIVSNQGGCSDTTFQSVCVLPQDPVFIPDIFSPNEDGNNDVFIARGQGIESVEMEIFSRYGQRVFSSRDKSKGWDGRTGGALAPSGNYLYMIIIELSDGSVQELKGEVTLVR